ncbi:MAG: DUF2520 domain-containing protein, partial [Thermodesulfobacteriota bacterium]|nr:DUF2520 domain-containing protein [Thermodesulfobacteriota bacterium]
MKKETIAIIGLGKVGTATGYLLRLSGYEIRAIADKSSEALKNGVGYTGGRPFNDPVQASLLADSIFITTTDDFIEPVCNAIAAGGGISPGKKVVHMSGAGGL